MELHRVLRALKIKGKMMALVKEKGALALKAMQQQDLGDVDVDIIIDETAAGSGDGGAALMEGMPGREFHLVPGG